MNKQPAQKRLMKIIDQFQQSRVLVIGDLIADQFIYGEISRVSREAPVFILRHERTETLPGGAANCAMNLASLGVNTTLIGCIGDDEAGRELLNKLKAAKVNCGGVVTLPKVRTTTKVRILAGQDHSTRQQVIRVDYENDALTDEATQSRIMEHIQHEVPNADSVIISDYNYGVVDIKTVQTIRTLTNQRHLHVFVDSRFHLSELKGFTSATPNEDEVEKLIGKKLIDLPSLEATGTELLKQALLITRGKNGMVLLEDGKSPLHIQAVGSLEPVDVTGAGDTVIATYAAAIASGANFAEAAHLANHAGGLVVMKRGTASVSQQEILSSIRTIS
jgi:D-glycero-beta-D-manno-heptose-7-phosphate kinase